MRVYTRILIAQHCRHAAMLATSCFCNKLRRSARIMTQLYDEALAPLDLKVTQFVLLRALERLGEASISELAEAVVLERSTLGRNIRLLEQRELVHLTEGNDQRTQQIRLTTAGKKMIARAVPHWESVQARIGKQFSAAQKAQLFALLDQIETLA